MAFCCLVEIRVSQCYLAFELTNVRKFHVPKKRGPYYITFFESVITHTECMAYGFVHIHTHIHAHPKRIDCKHATLENIKMPVPFPTRAQATKDSHIGITKIECKHN